MSKPIPPTYKTTNWSSYNEALKRRGSLTLWFDADTTWEAAPSGSLSEIFSVIFDNLLANQRKQEITTPKIPKITFESDH